MLRSEYDNRTISSVNSGHLRSVIGGQPTSALTMERDILKKATAYFAKAQLPGTR